jgi:2-phospho-L-lactate guanylyltransferase
MVGVTGGWVAVVPVKRLAVAKTRLRGTVVEVPHEALVLAMLADTLAAVRSCAAVDRVLVVTDDPAAARLAGEAGAERVPDGRGDLNAALAAGALRAAGACVAALTGDLPALRAAELAAALAALDGRPRGYVPDARGTGTALLAARAGTPLEPRFGPGSAAAHEASGAVMLSGDWPSVRQDVDTAADLAAAVGLGLGRHTAALIGAARYRDADAR